MDARFYRAVVLTALVPLCAGASYRTTNFVIQAPDAQLAEGLGKAAEKYRRELAVSWLGHELPAWSSPCPVRVRVGPSLGAGGVTRFEFIGNRAAGWDMSIQGSRQRLFDSVLPHEITHTVLATHFGCPLPRWADEGAATSVECQAELTRHYQMLIDFLRHGRGISFRRMFAMREYPRDPRYMLPLYAQGYSLVKYLIQRGGRRKYVQFVEDGIKTNNWSAAVQRHYGVGGVMPLQDVWLAWIRGGCRPPEAPSPAQPRDGILVAEGGKLPLPEPTLVLHTKTPEPVGDAGSPPVNPNAAPDSRNAIASAAGLLGSAGNTGVLPGPAGDSPLRWYRAGDAPRGDGRRPIQPVETRPPGAAPDAQHATQIARPPKVGQTHQIILQWEKQPLRR